MHISDSGAEFNVDAWPTVLPEHGVADSGPLQSLLDSLDLWFFSTY